MTQNNPIHILFASRLVYEKGADILIQAIDQSISGDDTSLKWVVWHICSDGPYKDDILLRIQSAPERVIYHGILDQKKLAFLYSEMDYLFMPSRFLETFWLTALESLASGTPVIGFSKGWLIPFIPPKYTLDPDTPVESLSIILQDTSDLSSQDSINLTSYSRKNWEKSLKTYFHDTPTIMILHDYHEKIWWAEYYVAQVESSLLQNWYTVSRYWYVGRTTPWKRRWIFIFSFFAFWRGASVLYLLKKHKPDAIWMHSVQRYIGFWWVCAAMQYVKNTWAKVYLSHHDVWLIAAFPQDITREDQIPLDSSIGKFIAWLSLRKKLVALGKWMLIYLLRLNFPKNLEHIIFSPFLESYIQAHFPGNKVHIFPHSFDEKIFYQRSNE